MLKDITLGQYYPGESVIHKLDPRVKLLATIIFIISLFAFGSAGGYVIATIFLFSVIRLSGVPLKFMTKGLKAIFILMLITVAFNLFLTPGEPLVHIWKLTITKEGLRMALLMAIRLIYLVMGSSVMTLTTLLQELSTTILLYGPKTKTVPIQIFNAVEGNNLGYASALSTVLLVVVFVIIYTMNTRKGTDLASSMKM